MPVGSIGRLLRSAGSSAQEETRPQSSRADGLLAEFESSEKGWFWETTRDGTLSYISESVARALGRDASDLLDRPFADLVSSETADGAATSERTRRVRHVARSMLVRFHEPFGHMASSRMSTDPLCSVVGNV